MTRNLTTNVLIFIYLIFFYSQLISLLPLCGVIPGITPKTEAVTRGGGVGSGARLDTFGVRMSIILFKIIC